MRYKLDHSLSFKKGAVSRGLLFVFVIVVVFGAYYLFFGNKKSAPVEIKYTKQDLAEAKNNVYKATSDLNSMIQRSSVEWPVFNQVRDQYSKVENIVTSKTDTLFNNPESQNPEIKINAKDKTLVATINNDRSQINELFNKWNDTITAINSNSSTTTLVSLIDTAKKDISDVKNYIAELKVVLATATPDNSGLTQGQIDSYKNSVDSAVLEVKSAESEMAVIESPTETQAPAPNENNNENKNVVAIPPPAPIVTPEQIKTQEEVVAQAEQKEAEIQDQINQTDNTGNAPASTDNTQNTIENNFQQDSGLGNQDSQFDDTSGQDQGESAQKQMPKLIQGSSNL